MLNCCKSIGHAAVGQTHPPRRLMLRNRWFPSSSFKRPPSSLTPRDGRWFRQSRVQSNLRTQTLVLGPIQSLILGFESSWAIASETSAGSCSELSWPIRREIIPHSWSQLSHWLEDYWCALNMTKHWKIKYYQNVLWDPSTNTTMRVTFSEVGQTAEIHSVLGKQHVKVCHDILVFRFPHRVVCLRWVVSSRVQMLPNKSPKKYILKPRERISNRITLIINPNHIEYHHSGSPPTFFITPPHHLRWRQYFNDTCCNLETPLEFHYW